MGENRGLAQGRGPTFTLSNIFWFASPVLEFSSVRFRVVDLCKTFARQDLTLERSAPCPFCETTGVEVASESSLGVWVGVVGRALNICRIVQRGSAHTTKGSQGGL